MRKKLFVYIKQERSGRYMQDKLKEMVIKRYATKNVIEKREIDGGNRPEIAAGVKHVLTNKFRQFESF